MNIDEAKAEATKLSRRLAQHTDLRLENMWGEFCAHISWTQNKIDALSPSQVQEKSDSLQNLLNEFQKCLEEPSAKETPSCIMAGIFLLEFIEKFSL